MGEVILVTGATGVVGQSLLPRLAANAGIEKLVALVRPQSKAPLPRVPVVRGDVTSGATLGIDAVRAQRITETVTTIIHAAADVRFGAPLEEVRRTNVSGTENVLRFAERCRRLRRISVLSTVYVAGRRTAMIREGELEHAAGFVNAYEQSKYEAELLLRDRMRDLPISVLRLGTVLGDSETGEVPHMVAIHHALRFYYHSLAPMIPGTPASPVDLVALDYAADAVAHLSGSGFQPGRTFHVCGGTECLTLAEILDLTLESFLRFRPAWRKRAIERPALVDLPTFELFASSVEEVGDSALLASVRVLRHFAPQLAFPKTFDDVQCAAALADSGIERPRIREYYPRVVRWLIEAGWTDHRTGEMRRQCS